MSLILKTQNYNVTHINKGKHEVQAVMKAGNQVFPYYESGLVPENSVLVTQLGYSLDYVKMLRKAGYDIYNISEDAIGTKNLRLSDYSVGSSGSSFMTSGETYDWGMAAKDYAENHSTVTNLYAKLANSKIVVFSTKAFEYTENEITLGSKGMGCFSYCQELVYVDFGKTVFKMASTTHRSLFSMCTKLKEVDFGNSYFSGTNPSWDRTFSDCESLEYINFGPNMKLCSTNSWGVFMNCNNLKKIVLTQELYDAFDAAGVLNDVPEDCEYIKL